MLRFVRALLVGSPITFLGEFLASNTTTTKLGSDGYIYTGRMARLALSRILWLFLVARKPIVLKNEAVSRAVLPYMRIS